METAGERATNPVKKILAIDEDILGAYVTVVVLAHELAQGIGDLAAFEKKLEETRQRLRNGGSDEC